MLNRFKSAVIGAVSSIEPTNGAIDGTQYNKANLAPKFPYGRPHFLGLGDDEVQMSADHKLRPIIHPNKPLPYESGYAECVNAGKSRWNEDQAVYRQGVLTKSNIAIPYTYYGIFDGHAGVGAALCAANQLHHIIHEKLVDAQDDIWVNFNTSNLLTTKPRDLLIIGALESSFREMDQLLLEDRNKYQAAGGCTAIVALFILGKLYLANAGDSRAIICKNEKHFPMSMDFTPENERDRIRRLAQEQPALLGKEFTAKEYLGSLRSGDLGKTVMFRDAYMKGWAYKTLQPEDLKMSVITGHGKRSRVMGTIGVTRGFGDHDLTAVYQKLPIKPFLSSHPEVQVHKLNATDESEVLVMGTDGLWDVTDGSKAAEIVSKSLTAFEDKKYISAATCLVGYARGTLGNSWQLKGGKPASCDDISVFVIPLLPYKQEYEDLLSKCNSHVPSNISSEYSSVDMSDDSNDTTDC
ncbi:protein phosphatase 1H [Anthonomus grandis grandis]|uniref:protein phosphatase 1H n=1 Tax=Anthonomus grandis grandis TaxID=2921223 RepID=UPI0021652548|nr:protein phosphatase 1H [Anthonomus grandis grandis]